MITPTSGPGIDSARELRDGKGTAETVNAAAARARLRQQTTGLGKGTLGGPRCAAAANSEGRRKRDGETLGGRHHAYALRQWDRRPVLLELSRPKKGSEPATHRGAQQGTEHLVVALASVVLERYRSDQTNGAADSGADQTPAYHRIAIP